MAEADGYRTEQRVLPAVAAVSLSCISLALLADKRLLRLWSWRAVLEWRSPYFEHELHTRRRFSRNVGLGLALGAFVVHRMLGLTVVKVKSAVSDPCRGSDHVVRPELVPGGIAVMDAQRKDRRDRLAGLVAGLMGALAWASVPFYELVLRASPASAAPPSPGCGDRRI